MYEALLKEVRITIPQIRTMKGRVKRLIEFNSPLYLTNIEVFTLEMRTEIQKMIDNNAQIINYWLESEESMEDIVRDGGRFNEGYYSLDYDDDEDLANEPPRKHYREPMDDYHREHLTRSPTDVLIRLTKDRIEMIRIFYNLRSKK